MFTFLVYLLFILVFILVAICIYNIICFISISSKLKGSSGKLTDSDIDELTKSSVQWNIWLILIIKMFKRKEGTLSKNRDIIIKKVAKTIKTIIVSVTSFLFTCAFYLFIFGIGISALDLAMTSASTAINYLFNKDDCICYAKCTNNAEDDAKCSYELIFGPQEYANLTNKMILTPEEYEYFPTITDGKALGEFIIKHINEDMVKAYKTALETKGIKKLHNKAKEYSKMTNDELQQDLMHLLADYKVNGRNPNCKCNEYNTDKLKTKCRGLEHWVEGWTWQGIGDGEAGGPGGTLTSSTTMGNATGQYAVQLDDGMYYWYHQDGGNGCSCVHCGNWSSAQWGGPTQIKHAFGDDGCAIYSLAIGISNLYGAEITPAVIFNDLNSPITNGSITTDQTYFSGRGVRYDHITKKLADKYGLDLTSTSTNNSNSVLIKFIDDTLSKGGIVWGWWENSLCDWCGNSDNKHFMCIRKSDGSNYYCFTSCKGKCASKGGKEGAIETMNHPLSKQDCVESLVDGKFIYGFVNPNANSGGQGQGGYNLTASDKELIEIFKNKVGVSEAKAYGLLACYKAATEAGLSSYETVGLIGCAMAEGTPGLVQYGHTLGSEKSTQSNPVYLNTLTRAQLAIDGNFSTDTGAGTAQWTNSRMKTYGEKVKPYVSNTPVNYTTLWSADYDMYKYELNGSYKSLITNMKDHNSTVESIVVFSMFKYEAGWGNYRNSDKIEDYTGTFRNYLETRYANALVVDKAFRESAK